MSDILLRLEEQIKDSFKNRNEVVLTTLRGVKTALQNLQIQLRPQGKDLTEADALRIFRGEIKKRQEAAGLYQQGGRQELADKELGEIKVLEKFLPPAPSEEAVREVISKLKNDLNCVDIKDMGKLTKATMEHFQNSADGKLVSTLVKQSLAS